MILPDSESCPFCATPGRYRRYLAREMMFGTREEYPYGECDACGSLWLLVRLTAELLGKAYGGGYYSFDLTPESGWRARLVAMRDAAELGGGSPAGRAFARRRGNATMRIVGSLLRGPGDSIADVGCGGGRLLSRLRAAGLRDLTGIDPFVECSQRLPNGVVIHKGRLDEVAERFDLIMFNHSLEHVAEPINELVAARSRLRPGGRLLVRVPTTSSEAWERFGVDWFQLDAPRHLAIPSRQGMAAAAAAAGFRIARTVDDSDENQFLLSELYRRDIPLREFDPARVDPAMRREHRAQAARVNASGCGDQVAFVLETVD